MILFHYPVLQAEMFLNHHSRCQNWHALHNSKYVCNAPKQSVKYHMTYKYFQNAKISYSYWILWYMQLPVNANMYLSDSGILHLPLAIALLGEWIIMTLQHDLGFDWFVMFMLTLKWFYTSIMRLQCKNEAQHAIKLGHATYKVYNV